MAEARPRLQGRAQVRRGASLALRACAASWLCPCRSHIYSTPAGKNLRSWLIKQLAILALVIAVFRMESSGSLCLVD